MELVTLKVKEAIKKVVVPSLMAQFEGEKDAPIIYMVGTPGIGKTSMQLEEYSKLGWGLYHIQLNTRPIEQLGGIPDIIRKDNYIATIWSLPEIIDDLIKMKKKYDKIVMFMDDLHLIPASIQELMWELLSLKRLRGYKIPDGVAFVMAGNDNVKAGAKKQFSAFVNRYIKIKVEPDLDQWIKEFALANNVHHAILSFLNDKSYSVYFLEEERLDEPWASPRSWTRLSTQIKYMEKAGINLEKNKNVLRATVIGAVGKNAGSEFIKYYELYSKIDREKIIKAEDYEIPDNTAKAYVFTQAAMLYLIDEILSTRSNKIREEMIRRIVILTARSAEKNMEITIPMLSLFVSHPKIPNREVKSKVLSLIHNSLKDIGDEILKYAAHLFNINTKFEK